MREQIITFETAKLAKEKGFEENSLYAYEDDKTLTNSINENGNSTFNSIDIQNCEDNGFEAYLAPTQSLLQKWLREEYKIYIEIKIQEAEILATWYWNIFTHREIGKGLIWIKNDSNGVRYSTYEEALEKGLQEALKLI